MIIEYRTGRRGTDAYVDGRLVSHGNLSVEEAGEQVEAYLWGCGIRGKEAHDAIAKAGRAYIKATAPKRNNPSLGSVKGVSRIKSAAPKSVEGVAYVFTKGWPSGWDVWEPGLSRVAHGAMLGHVWQRDGLYYGQQQAPEVLGPFKNRGLAAKACEASFRAKYAGRYGGIRYNPSQYDKVKALAERGSTEHERATAARILADMKSPAQSARQMVDEAVAQRTRAYANNAAILRSLQEGDKVEVIFAPRSSTSPDEKRTLTVTGAHSGVFYNIFVTSGKVRPGSFAGGNISDHGDSIYYQPTMQQAIREVRTLRKLGHAALPNPAVNRVVSKGITYFGKAAWHARELELAARSGPTILVGRIEPVGVNWYWIIYVKPSFGNVPGAGAVNGYARSEAEAKRAVAKNAGVSVAKSNPGKKRLRNPLTAADLEREAQKMDDLAAAVAHELTPHHGQVKVYRDEAAGYRRRAKMLGYAKKKNPYEKVGSRTPKRASMKAIGEGKYNKLRHALDGVRTWAFAVVGAEQQGRDPSRAQATLEHFKGIALREGAKGSEIESAEQLGYTQARAR